MNIFKRVGSSKAENTRKFRMSLKKVEKKTSDNCASDTAGGSQPLLDRTLSHSKSPSFRPLAEDVDTESTHSFVCTERLMASVYGSKSHDLERPVHDRSRGSCRRASTSCVARECLTPSSSDSLRTLSPDPLQLGSESQIDSPALYAVAPCHTGFSGTSSTSRLDTVYQQALAQLDMMSVPLSAENRGAFSSSSCELSSCTSSTGQSGLHLPRSPSCYLSGATSGAVEHSMLQPPSLLTDAPLRILPVRCHALYTGYYIVENCSQFTARQTVHQTMDNMRMNKIPLKMTPVDLTVSSSGIVVTNAVTQMCMARFTLSRVQFASTCTDHQLFSVLVQQPRGYDTAQCCYVFIINSADQAEQLQLLVNRAIQLASGLGGGCSSCSCRSVPDVRCHSPLVPATATATINNNNNNNNNNYRNNSSNSGGGGVGISGWSHLSAGKIGLSATDSGLFKPLLGAAGPIHKHLNTASSATASATATEDEADDPSSCVSSQCGLSGCTDVRSQCSDTRQLEPDLDLCASLTCLSLLEGDNTGRKWRHRHSVDQLADLGSDSSSCRNSSGFSDGTPLPRHPHQNTVIEHNMCDILIKAAWFQPGIPREIALEVLSRKPVGAFMVRESTTKPDCYALSLRVPETHHTSGIAHYLIIQKKEGVYQIKGFAKQFPSLASLIIHHSVMPELLPVPLTLTHSTPVSHTHSDSMQDLSELAADSAVPTSRHTSHRSPCGKIETEV